MRGEGEAFITWVTEGDFFFTSSALDLLFKGVGSQSHFLPSACPAKSGLKAKEMVLFSGTPPPSSLPLTVGSFNKRANCFQIGS